MSDFLHARSDFNELLVIVADQRGIDPMLVEKDYWIMHCLWGLQTCGFRYELKGGTSLSKGFGIIERFSEDIDIRIEPPDDLVVKVGRNHDKPAHVESRRAYYEWLSRRIAVPGVEAVERDTAFDDEKMRSAGIRLRYPNQLGKQSGIKDGILLELGFDDTTPNRPVTISSWAYDTAVSAGVQIFDNRAVDVLCDLPTYTFVEKLQTVSTKYRLQKVGEAFPANFMRHYYDIYCLLSLPEVQEFIGTPAYEARKVQRFRRGDELVVAKNPAFLQEDSEEWARFAREYQKTAALYYNGQPDFNDKDYLYRVLDAGGNAKSLGPRSPETEAKYQAFIEGKVHAKERFQALDERIRTQARLNKAVNLGRLPMVVADIFQAIDTSRVRDDFRVVGTHAIYAYESMAGAHLRMDLLASGDVDLLYDPRKKLSIVAKNLDGYGLLGLLRKVDASFEINADEPFRATNKHGFMVDLIIPQRDMREAGKITFAENDLQAVEVPNLRWLVNAPAVESIIIASNGMPVRAKVPDPRAFTVHKAWLSEQTDRDPVKKVRDLAQSKMVHALVEEYLPLHPFETQYLR